MNQQPLKINLLISQLSQILYKISSILLRNFNEMGMIGSETGLSKFTKDIDEKIEGIIMRELDKIYPEIPILFEGNKIIDGENKNMLFIIDPVDGTENFKNNISNFGVSLALKKDDEIILGMIIFPTSNELFVARKDHGCYLLNENQDKIVIRAQKKISKKNMFLFTRTSMLLNEKNWKILQYFAQQKVHIRCTGCVSMDLAYLSCGRANLIIFDRTKIWDIAAGELLVKEAGGLIYRDIAENGYCIAASSETLLKEIKYLILS